MSPLRSNTLWRPVRCRLTAGFALLAYLVSAVGLPVPALPHKDIGQPFPCQNRPCGCQSAEQCWRSCCCFTPEEHWAWARAHHVEPPAYATRPATLGWHTVRLRDQAAGCAEPSAGCAHCAPAAKACCRDGRQPRPKPAVGWRSASGMDVLRCQGVSNLWVSSATVLPPHPPLVWQAWQAPAGWLGGFDALPLVLSLAPPDPPPRFTHA
jgi:hypothetical protein